MEFSNYKKLISSSFWNSIKKETIVPYTSFPTDKNQYLESLFIRITNRQYLVSSPREYLIGCKGSNVIRVVPCFDVDELCTYFYAVKSIEESLVKCRTHGTFGGFRMGSTYIDAEKEDIIKDLSEIPFSVNTNNYNTKGWVDEWRNFSDLNLKYCEKNNYKYYIKFDISNFYDNLKLDYLECQVRSVCSNKDIKAINLLFFFLRNWNHRFNNYSFQNVGIPQDEQGECSRILANFYLHEYDAKISRKCIEKSAFFLRYADDQIIMANNKEDLDELFHIAGLELARIGLNINTGKVKYYNNYEKYYEYWAYDIYSLLKNIDQYNPDSVRSAVNLYYEKIDNKIDFRSDSAFRRILNSNHLSLSKHLRKKILNTCLKKDVLICCNARYLEIVWNLATSLNMQTQFILQINYLIETTYFNKFLYELLIFSKKHNRSMIGRIQEKLNLIIF